jgi:hypothetical protein
MPNGAPAFYQAYWQEFHGRLQAADHPFPALQNPPAGPDYHFTFGVGGSRLNVVANRQDDWVAVELYNTGPDAQRRYDLLDAERHDIERAFGGTLCWERQVPNGQASRIRCTLRGVDLENPAMRAQQHDWLIRSLMALYHAVVPRLRTG